MRADAGPEVAATLAATARELAPSAAALAGDRAAAERLVGDALRRTIRRWRAAASDPVGYARRAMYRKAVRGRAGRWSPSRSGAMGDDPTQMARRIRDGALRRLAPRDRAVLVLRHLEQRDEEQSAAVLGLTAGAVTAQLAEVHDRLRMSFQRAAELTGEEAELEDQIGRSLRDLADQVRPDHAGDAARAAARAEQRRRRYLSLGGIGAAALALVVAAVLVLLPSQPDPAPVAGSQVVASYQLGYQAYVLNPETGAYTAHPSPLARTVVSPDLRLVATPTWSSLSIAATTGGGVTREIPLPVPLDGGPVVWSPDGTRLVATVPDPAAGHRSRFARVTVLGGEVIRYWRSSFRRLLVVAAETGQAQVVDLALADDRVGSWGSAPAWLGPDRIAVLTAPAEPDPADPVAADTINVFDLAGNLVQELPLDGPFREPAAGVPEWSGWELAPSLADRDFLLARSVDGGTLELVTIDPASSERRPPVAVAIPDPATGAFWQGRVLAWRGGTEVLIEVAQLPLVSIQGDTRATNLPAAAPLQIDWWTVDVRTGTAEPTDLPVPPQAGQLGVVEAQPLSERASGLAF